MKFAALQLAARDKRGDVVEGGTVALVNPQQVRKIQPVVICTSEAGLPVGGVTQITYANGDTELFSGTVKDIRTALRA